MMHCSKLPTIWRTLTEVLCCVFGVTWCFVVNCVRFLHGHRSQRKYSNINIYEIYEDICVSSPDTFTSPLPPSASIAARVSLYQQKQRQQQQLQDQLWQQQQQHGFKSSFRVGVDQPPTSPCIDNAVTSYLNQANVQDAIHAPHIKWDICSSLVNYSYVDVLTSMLPVYKELFETKLRILVFSGDVDGIVPFIGALCLQVEPHSRRCLAYCWLTSMFASLFLYTASRVPSPICTRYPHLAGSAKPDRQETTPPMDVRQTVWRVGD